ncbi:primosomal protein N' [Clostridium sp. Marseille-Q2269]|uniref:primosomal protein N' n=1 Tax=Clostridium sp. Marseille-Q2269 TaxID=2942205 RepID=UPI002073C9E7|nr:primosomal protein N' [Clostridium sp. Marseille-Q2269]
MFKYAGIVVNNSSIKLDKLFTYIIPDKLNEKIKIGQRVKVPFGKGNKKIDGFVLDLYEICEEHVSMKSISNICEEKPLLDLNRIKLIEQMKEKYLCTYLEAIKVLIPPGITKGNKEKKENCIFTYKDLDGKYLKENYEQIYDFVKCNNGVYNKNALNKKFGFSLSSINTLIKHGFLIQKNKVVNRYNEKIYNNYEEKILNGNQSLALYRILNSNRKLFLIHGVTGSGKTEIYMHLVKKLIKVGKDSIILVPEISLTPQMVERFKGRFGKDIAVFHSKLSDGERFDEWIRVKRGEVKVAIGARSAVFLPFKNLGAIIIDEEHESSYKSDSNPKYSARDIAEFRCINEGCKVILGSATPSLETYYKSKNNMIDLITIDERIEGADMPDVKIVDMREELMSGNKSIFSRELFEDISIRIEKKEQIILFLNRRGFSTFVSCRECGYVFKCKNCDISLTYHNRDSSLRCHYCGEKIKIPKQCPKCNSRYVKYFGTGTEKVEKAIKKYLPQVRTLRMDLDTTRTKNAYENIYNAFKNGEADILIGTQMIAKGLDFQNVTLVGVLAADMSLNLPDYRSSERTFQLITQVSGRAGRGKKKGKVLIQSYNPENYSITSAAKGDYEGFYMNEIKIRKDMNYPPFSKILIINLSGKYENKLIKNTHKIGIILKNVLSKYDNLNMLGPCPSPLSKIKEMYRWQIILKGNVTSDIMKEVKKIVYTSLDQVYNDIRVSIDINPNSLL